MDLLYVLTGQGPLKDCSGLRLNCERECRCEALQGLRRGSIAPEISLPRGIDVEIFALGGEHRNHLGEIFKIVLVPDFWRGIGGIGGRVIGTFLVLQNGAQVAFVAQFQQADRCEAGLQCTPSQKYDDWLCRAPDKSASRVHQDAEGVGGEKKLKGKQGEPHRPAAKPMGEETLVLTHGSVQWSNLVRQNRETRPGTPIPLRKSMSDPKNSNNLHLLLIRLVLVRHLARGASPCRRVSSIGKTPESLSTAQSGINRYCSGISVDIAW